MLTDNESDKLLMIPGPTPVHHDILTALSEPTISHTSAALAEVIHVCLDGLKSVSGTESAFPFIFAGAGTLAQEASIVNVVSPGERILVASNGFFGDRFVAIAQAYGIDVEHLAAKWGVSVTAEEVDEALAGNPAKAVYLTQVDTSTGVAAPVQEIAETAKKHGALVIVDAVCALGGMPAEMDARSIDIILSGAQKALGVPPGLAILAISPAAMAKRRSMERVPAYYADLLNWEASMRDPKVYFSTHAVNMFYALKAGLDIVMNEGLSRRFARHERLSRGFRSGMQALGFDTLTDNRYLAPTLSVLAYPDGVEDEPFRLALSRRGVIAAGCLGEFKGRGVRFGHMGNIDETEILQSIAAVEESLIEVGARIVTGRGVAAARQGTTPALVAG